MSAKAMAVIAGLTRVNPAGYGGWAGDCPGCDVDIRDVEAAVTRRPAFVGNVKLFNSSATWLLFAASISNACAQLSKDDFLIIYRSGHGGRVPDNNGDEQDGYDETLCLWDRQVRDDEMWALLCACVPAGLRVLLLTDACHSETAFRAVPDLAAGAADKGKEFQGRLLSISGCADDKVSWGGSDGGKLTRAALKELRDDITYAQWFARISARMGDEQVPKMAEIGESFKDMAALT